MAEAVGPIWAAGFQQITKSGYDIIFLPDLHNDELQKAGKAPVYYWLPNTVRLARKGGDAGDYKFHFIHFEGVRSDSTSIGVEGNNEVTGGLLGFSTTSAPPISVLQECQDTLLNIFKGNDDKYWGWRTPVAPMFRPAPIVSNTTTITNLSPNPDGSVPAPAPTGGTTTPAPGPAGPPGVGPRSLAAGRRLALTRSFQPPIFQSSLRSVPLRSAMRASNLDQWYCNLQGQGSGSVNPLAENAYSGLVGSLPAALIWSSFHGGTGGISVWQKLRLKVWSPAVHIHIEGDWDKIQAHFSAAGHYGGLFWGGDIQAQFNYMKQEGMITVVTEVDTTLPNADKMNEELNKRTDLVFSKFMDAAQKVIFDPAPFNEKPAEASGGFLGFGGGVAFKLRVDMTHLHLAYDERKEMAYLQDYPISGQLEGMYDEIKADPSAEKKYFTTLYLDDWERKVSRVVKPVVNWPDPGQKWAGEPVAFLSCQVGYPNTDGAIQWDGHVFQRTDPPEAGWNTAMAMKKATDVTNAPSGWKPDQTFIKRQVHFTEPPSELENPFVRIAVEKNVVDLDPGENGTLTSDLNLEVRVDNVGALNVGPIFLNVDLENTKQVVEVTFQAEGKTADGNDRPPVKFSWKFEDQAEPRFWMIFTGQPDFIPRYKYQVRVIVKGSLFTKGMEWTGPWVDAAANGPIMVSVPTQEEAVSTKSLVPGAPSYALPAAQPSAPPARPTTRRTPVSAAPPAQPRAREAQPTGANRILGWSPVPSSRPPASRAVPAPGNGGGAEMFSGFSEHAPSS
jgi:hypothetical protein